MFVTQKSLPRRTILRGAGTALALPLLDAMVPALKAERLTAAAAVRRLGFMMYPLGVDQDRWRPKGEGSDYQLSEALAPLAPHKKKFVVISGLSSDPDRSKPGFHDRALASFMTGVEPTKGKIHVGISIDQLAAQTLGKETQFASLELAADESKDCRSFSQQHRSVCTSAARLRPYIQRIWYLLGLRAQPQNKGRTAPRKAPS
jgi:hypothetical protein